MIAARPSSECDVEGFACAAQQQAADLVRENPAVAMMVVFGVGLAVGVAMGELMSSTNRVNHNNTLWERAGRELYNAMPFRG